MQEIEQQQQNERTKKKIIIIKSNYNENVMYAHGMDDLSIFAVIFFFIRFIHIFCVILPLFCSFLLKHSNNTHSYSEKRGEQTFLTHKFQRLEHHTNSETGKNTTEQERNKILIFIILNCIQ